MRDVVLSSNDAGVDYLLVTAYSLLSKYRGTEPIRINVLDGYGGLKEANRTRIRELVAQYPPALVRFISIEPMISPVRDQLTGGGRWNVFVWSSVLGPDLVADAAGNLLYMDIDQLVNADVSPLFEMDLGDAWLAAVYENDRQFGTRNSREWDVGILPKEAKRYFNVGTMVFNVERFRRDGVRQKIVDWYLAHRNLATRLDQDAFNAVCWQRTKRLAMAWGFHDRTVRKIACVDMTVPHVFGYRPLDCYDAALRPRIFHFMGRKKPWRPSHRPYRKLYHAAMRAVGLTPPREELLAPLHDLLTRRALRRIQRRDADFHDEIRAAGGDLVKAVSAVWRRRRAHVKTIKNGLLLPFEWGGILFGLCLFAVLPHAAMLAMCDFASAVMYFFDRRGRVRSRENLGFLLAASQVTLSSRAIDLIVRRAYRNMARTVGHAFWTCTFARRRVAAVGVMSEESRSFLLANKPAVTVSGHIGCWEILSQLAQLEGHEMMSVAKDVGTPAMTRLLMHARRSIGQKIVHADGAFKALMGGIRSGRSLGLLVDQRVDPGEGGVWIRFLGKPIPVSAAPAFFASKAKVPIITAWSRPLRDGRYVCECIGTYPPEAAKDIWAMTQRCALDLEKVIRRHPSCWVLNYNFFSNVPAEKDLATLAEREAAFER